MAGRALVGALVSGVEETTTVADGGINASAPKALRAGAMANKALGAVLAFAVPACGSLGGWAGGRAERGGATDLLGTGGRVVSGARLGLAFALGEGGGGETMGATA